MAISASARSRTERLSSRAMPYSVTTVSAMSRGFAVTICPARSGRDAETVHRAPSRAARRCSARRALEGADREREMTAGAAVDARAIVETAIGQ
jgi:hypothetical protein